MRMWRHLTMTRWRLRRAFPQRVLDAIEQAVHSTESAHGGEIRVAIEADLPLIDLIRGVTPRERALQVFSMLGAWDTRDNNGVLIYLLLADRDVEIVADRGFNQRVDAAEWTETCHRMEARFAAADYEHGMLDGVAAVGALIARHFPAVDRNELPNRPVAL